MTLTPDRAITRRASNEVREVCALTRTAIGSDPTFVNLATPGAVVRYARKADEVCRLVRPGSSVLDWGCGSGLMSYLLARRGLQLQAVDVALPRWVIAREAGIEPLIAPGRDAPLPFPDTRFSAVVGCGVLEHVADQQERLRELRRVLEPGGLLFVYNYPNALSWVEWLSEKLYRPAPVVDAEGNIHGHERKLRTREFVALVSAAGFDILATRVEDVLPVTMRALPAPLRRMLLKPYRAWALVDRALLSVWPIGRLGTNLTVVARRRG